MLLISSKIIKIRQLICCEHGSINSNCYGFICAEALADAWPAAQQEIGYVLLSNPAFDL